MTVYYTVISAHVCCLASNSGSSGGSGGIIGGIVGGIIAVVLVIIIIIAVLYWFCVYKKKGKSHF